jgi:hypothetical protein
MDVSLQAAWGFDAEPRIAQLISRQPFKSLCLTKRYRGGLQVIDKHAVRAQAIVRELSDLHPRLERAIDGLRVRERNDFRQVTADNLLAFPEYIRLLAVLQGTIKLRLIIEQGFVALHTLNVLATTRYVAELLVWYRLLMKDVEKYAPIHQVQIIADQIGHVESNLAKIRAEIELFRALDAQERNGVTDAVSRASGSAQATHTVASAIAFASDEADRAARRNFSLYFEDAKINGFGLQASLMEKKAIPIWEARRAELAAVREAARAQVANWPKKWNWTVEAANAGLSAQFDFIYGYTSRLLHARPASFNTDEKNLEFVEMAMFLDFTYVAMLEMTETAERLANISGGASH